MAVVQASLEMVLESPRVPTAREVAERVGVTERTIFNLFNGKKGMMFAVVVAFRARALRQLPEVPPNDDVEGRVLAFFGAIAPLMEEYAHVRWILMTASETVPDVERGVVTQALRSRVHELLGTEGASMSDARRAALHAAIDPMTWRIYRTQQGLSIEQSALAMASSVVSFAKR